MEIKKSQITVIEISLVILMFGVFITNFGGIEQSEDIDPILRVDSLLDSIYQQGSFREIVMQENLSSSSLSQDWSNLTLMVEKNFQNYELVIYNDSRTKFIESCTQNYYKNYAERVFAIEDNDNYEFRVLRLGVCY